MNDLKDKMDMILETQNKISDKQTVMSETLIRQEENLKEHMRRSLLNEEAIDILREEFKPVEKHVFLVNFTLKVFGGLLGSSLFIFLLNYLTKRN